MPLNLKYQIYYYLSRWIPVKARTPMLFLDEQPIRQDYTKIFKMTILLLQYVLPKEVLILIYK